MQEKPIVELANCGGKTYVRLRPYFGNYRGYPYECDTARGRKFWDKHLMEKDWFTHHPDLQIKYNEAWDVYEEAKEYYNGRNWKRGRQADSYQMKISVKDCLDIKDTGKITRKLYKVVDEILENFVKDMDKREEGKYGSN